jgi:vacuolar-type H+-ATPase subunit F/Vma7
MKRERRVLAIVGSDQVVVSVLYRGKLWFESLEVRVLNKKRGNYEILKLKYLDQARIILINERLSKHFEIDIKGILLASIPKGRDVEVIVVSEESAPILHEKIKKLCVQGDVPEALRVARRILNELRNIMSKTV